MVVSVVFITLLFAVDRILKIYLSELLISGNTIMLIPGVIQLSYAENRGAAFSIFSGHRTLLIIVTGIGILFMIIFFFIYKFKKEFAKWALAMVIAGGIGNFYDRLVFGYVVDYFELLFMNFAIFNFADCLINIGAALLIIYLLFFEWKSESAKKEPDVRMDE